MYAMIFLILNTKKLLKMANELAGPHEKREDFDRRIAQFAKTHPVCQRRLTIPGVGVLTTTVLLALVGDPFRFKNGHHFAAYVGLVSRQYSSGGKERAPGDLKTRRHLSAHPSDPRRTGRDPIGADSRIGRARTSRERGLDRRPRSPPGIQQGGRGHRQQECPDPLGAAHNERGGLRSHRAFGQESGLTERPKRFKRLVTRYETGLFDRIYG